MKRLHLFEFEDQSWFPQVIRNGITDYLHFIVTKSNLYKNLIPLFVSRLNKNNQIIDLCSGGSGGILYIFNELKNIGITPKITLTDKYPNIDAFEKIKLLSNNEINYISTPIDATNIPEELKGLRSQFVSFHHFKPKEAIKILENSVKNNSSIIIIEITEKTFINFLFCLLAPLLVMLVTPFIKPFKLSKLFFTYIIPAIPFFVMWDGIVSILRTYNISELKQLTANFKTYNWEIGKFLLKSKLSLLYLIGYPKND